MLDKAFNSEIAPLAQKLGPSDALAECATDAERAIFLYEQSLRGKTPINIAKKCGISITEVMDGIKAGRELWKTALESQSGLDILVDMVGQNEVLASLALEQVHEMHENHTTLLPDGSREKSAQFDHQAYRGYLEVVMRACKDKQDLLTKVGVIPKDMIQMVETLESRHTHEESEVSYQDTDEQILTDNIIDGMKKVRSLR